MKQTLLALALAGALMAAAPAATAQATPPPLPQLTAEQSTRVDQEMDRYRREIDARLTRGEITPDEAQRLSAWHQWQYAQQIARPASPGPMAQRSAGVPPDYVPPPAPYYESTPYYAAPAPYYAAPVPYYAAPAPYYAYPPYYAAPRVYWGPTVCAGGFGRHSFARFCL
jgi:hypothetical protein